MERIFKFYSPHSGGWTVVMDENSEMIYSGHDNLTMMVRDILSSCGVNYEYYEMPDEEYEEMF